MPISRRELSILQCLCAANSEGFLTRDVAASLPIQGNSQHEHSAAIRTWLEALQSYGFIESRVAMRLTVWQITDLGRKVVDDGGRWSDPCSDNKATN
jgi:hypothetical protein